MAALRKVSHEVVAAARSSPIGRNGRRPGPRAPARAAPKSSASAPIACSARCHADSRGTSPMDSPRPSPRLRAGLRRGPLRRHRNRQGPGAARRRAARGRCATDVTALALEGGKVLATRPVYAGKAIQRVRLNGKPAIVSLRPNTFPVDEAGKAGASGRSSRFRHSRRG